MICEVSHITCASNQLVWCLQFPFVLNKIIWKSYQWKGKYKIFKLWSFWSKNFFLMILCQTWESFISYWSKVLDKNKLYRVIHIRRCNSCCMSHSSCTAVTCPCSCTPKAVAASCPDLMCLSRVWCAADTARCCTGRCLWWSSPNELQTPGFQYGTENTGRGIKCQYWQKIAVKLKMFHSVI